MSGSAWDEPWQHGGHRISQGIKITCEKSYQPAPHWAEQKQGRLLSSISPGKHYHLSPSSSSVSPGKQYHLSPLSSTFPPGKYYHHYHLTPLPGKQYHYHHYHPTPLPGKISLSPLSSDAITRKKISFINCNYLYHPTRWNKIKVEQTWIYINAAKYNFPSYR